MDTATIVVRGSGGSEFTLDVPRPGSHARIRLDQQLAKGELILLADPTGALSPATEEPATADPAEETPAPFTLDGLDKDQLVAFAAEHGLEVDKRLGADRIRDELMATLNAIAELTADPAEETPAP